MLQEETDKLHNELQNTVAEKQRYQQKLSSVEQELANMQENKAKDYAVISSTLLQTVEKELESLRVGLKIPSLK